MVNGKVIADYMRSKGWQVFDAAGHLNIVYVEGVNHDLTPNDDRPDQFNDRRLIIDASAGRPEIIFNVAATTEPGIASTHTSQARRLKGVARIAFGQYTAWRQGFHKGDPAHPALVQAVHGIIKVHRDMNEDYRRTGDKIHTNVSGLNQHATRPDRIVRSVGHFSAGCLVGHLWSDHEVFIDITKSDKRYIADPRFLYTTTIIAGDDLYKFATKK